MGSPTTSTDVEPKLLARTIPYLESPKLQDRLAEPAPPPVSIKTWKVGETVYEAVFVDGRVTATFTKTKPSSTSDLDRYRIEAVTLGMTQDKVEAEIGKPTIRTGVRPKDARECSIWEGEKGFLILRFADDGKTKGTDWKPKKK
jgi:hypothetical protein